MTETTGSAYQSNDQTSHGMRAARYSLVGGYNDYYLPSINKQRMYLKLGFSAGHKENFYSFVSVYKTHEFGIEGSRIEKSYIAG